jgi:hypothetical protein
VTSVALGARRRDGFVAIGVGNPASAQFRPRPRRGTWSCPQSVALARTFALEDARDAVAMLARAHPGGSWRWCAVRDVAAAP